MKRVLFLLVFLGLSIGIAHAEITANPKALNQQPINQSAERDYVLDMKGGLWLAYYDNDSFLYVRRPDGSEVKLGAQDRERYQSGFCLLYTSRCV